MDRKHLRRIVGAWRLEWKLVVLLGTSLLTALFIAFWAVQSISERLVMERTRQAARDYASYTFVMKHMNNPNRADSDSIRLPANPTAKREKKVFEDLRASLGLQAGTYEERLLKLKDDRQYWGLKADEPESDFEIRLLEEIALEIQEKWRPLDEESTSEPLPSNETTPSDKSTTDPSSSVSPNPATTSSEAKKESSNSTPSQSLLEPRIFREAGPIDGKYFYYHPLRFNRTCLDCHGLMSAERGSTATAEYPLRIIRVGMPYDETRVWTIWSFSMMIAIAIATLSVTMFLFHWILRALVIKPIAHLREVSEEVSHGRTDLRATLNTEDEIHELGDAFNRMILHLTDSELELRTLNKELDRRVDQLAQANLQLYEANRLKSEFLANMSHELRTPLNSILGFSEVLQNFDSLNDRQKRYAANIQRSGRLLLNMINDILDLAKVEAGKMEVRPTHFDLLSVVHGQCDIVRSLSEEKNIDLQVESKLDELLVYQDQAKIQQILTNLLSNAIKFTPEGGLITVTVGMADHDRIYISVADTGVGIAESDFEIIFEKFRQSKNVTGEDGLTREYTGTGLGLSIVRELCKLLGGEVMLSSQLGQGSTFRVELNDHYMAVVPPNAEHIGHEDSIDDPL